MSALGVAEPKVFLPDDNDEIAAAAAEMVMLREDPGIPAFEEVDLWLILGKNMRLDQGEVNRCLSIFRSFYLRPDFREQVIEPSARKKLEALREHDSIWERYKK